MQKIKELQLMEGVAKELQAKNNSCKRDTMQAIDFYFVDVKSGEGKEFIILAFGTNSRARMQ